MTRTAFTEARRVLAAVPRTAVFSVCLSATSAGAKVVSINTEHIELVGPASVLSPELLEGLSLKNRRQ